MKLDEKKIISELKEHGYKLTPQRRAVVRAVTSCNDHLSPFEIHDKVLEKYPGTGLVTVYRTLEILTELGLVCELHSAGNGRSYTAGEHRHHHHLICSGCGTVVNFAGRYLEELESNLQKESGFRIDKHLLEFVGLCRDCQKAV